ncbi:MAG: DNA replication and repair protein RecF [Chitinophagaceae bacterium]
MTAEFNNTGYKSKRTTFNFHLLQLHSISLLQFKNYAQANFSFTERIVGICGSNGIGKTNLLDAIHYLCFTKSYFGKTDAQHVLNGAQGFRLAGNVSVPGQETAEVICILRETGKKEFLLDGEPYDKFAQHIGKLPCVFIAPDDVQMITGTSEERRRFIDALLCQLDARYLQQLMSYNKTLQQRNSYLKSLQPNRGADKQLLDVYDNQLIQHGNYVFEQRVIFLQKLAPLVQTFYEEIAGRQENISIAYESPLLQTAYPQLLQQTRDKDILLQRTTQGIHRDDLYFALEDAAFKSIASQGQRKSLLFALKLAEFDILKENKGFPPFLLLDDVFEKLDAQRMHQLLNKVCVENKGQVFITDTHCDRLNASLKELNVAYQVIELKS